MRRWPENPPSRRMAATTPAAPPRSSRITAPSERLAVLFSLLTWSAAMSPPLHDNAEVAKCLGELPRTLKIGAYDWVITFETSDSELEGQAEWETHFVRLWPAALTSPSHVV